MSYSLEDKVSNDLSSLLRNTQFPPGLRKLYVYCILDGMEGYLNLVKAQKEELKLKGMLQFYTNLVMANASSYQFSPGRAKVQGAAYADSIILEVLGQKLEKSGADIIFVDEISWDEIVMASEKLKMAIRTLLLERDPLLVAPGERLNLEEIRPKNPTDANCN